MSDDSIKSAIRLMKAHRERLLEQAAAEIDRDMAADLAELERLAAKYNLRVVGTGAPGADIADTLAKTVVTEMVVPTAERAQTMTLRELADLYRSDERSPYRSLRYTVRGNYDSLIDRIVAEMGDMHLGELNADNIQKFYDGWAADGKVALGHSMATKLRGLLSFGTTTLNDAGCQRCSTIMSRIRFPIPKARTEALTAAQVESIRAKAHEMGKPSIALAQAIQFQLMLNQKDVIGEWVPATEPGESEFIIDGNKWLHGIRWEEFDGNLVLRHVTSFRQKKIEVDFKRSPMVMEELQKRGGIVPKSGPVIVSEWSGKPWSSAEFRRWWRKLADASGVPKSVKNMDSRPLEARSTTTRNAINGLAPQERLIH
jgi:hypothetical protein